MKTESAVLYEMQKPQPYRDSQPLVIEQVELDAPGPGEVLVEVAYAGLCHSDLSVINGTRPRVTPMVLGHEASGIVREVGMGIADLKPDDHVVFSFVPQCGRCPMCLRGRAVLCEPGGEANVAGTLLTGTRRFRHATQGDLHHHLGVSGFSRFTVAARESLVRVDPALPLDTAALFGCATLTGVGAVMNTAKVQPGESVAVFGLGGVGISVVLGAAAVGADPIVAVDRLPAKLELAQSVGATAVVRADEEDAIEQVRALTDGGATFTFECVGHEKVLAQAYTATARGGTTVAIGLPHPSKQLTIPALSLIGEERTLKGSYMGSSVPHRDLPRYERLHRAGRLPVEKLKTREIELETINEAFDDLAEGKHVRQLVKLHST